MKFTSVMPILRTHNLEETITFYRDLLGFECTKQADDWALIERDNITLMIALPNAHEPFDTPCFTGSLYFTVDDRRRSMAQVKETTEIFYPIQDFAYGMREFAICDRNGYCLQFGKDIG
jgi:uncharacterized glyoxalase superfamily protein PhnB